MIKKQGVLLASVAAFIVLTFISFNLSNKEEAQVSASPIPETSPIPSADANLNAEKTNSDKQNENETKAGAGGDIVINDLKAQVSGNEVNLTWTQPSLTGITALRILRTPSNLEGGSAVYNIQNSKGKFIDKNLKPGVRYYYEIIGNAGERNLYSGVVSAEINGKIKINIGDNFMTVNDEKKFFAQSKPKTYAAGENVMLPAKGIVEVLGGTVSWKDENKKTNTKSAAIKFRDSDIELFVGKNSISVNKQEKKIASAPIINDGVLYIPHSLLSEYLNCAVNKNGNILNIDKPIDETSENSKEKQKYSEDVNVTQGGEFEITLPDQTSDGKKWYYKSDVDDFLVLTSKTAKDEKCIYRFKALKEGDIKLEFKYFNSTLGESKAEQNFFYSIKVTPKG